MTCGIVILNYNDYETTAKLLDRIKNYESINYIAVVDNHSTDDSYQRLCRYSNERIHILCSPGNDGYSKGNNIGIRYLIQKNVDVICISNPDVEFDEKLVIRVMGQFKRRTDYAIITGLQKTPEGEVAGHPFWPEYTTLQWFKMKLSNLRPVMYTINPQLTQNYIKQKLSGKRSFFRVGAVEGSLFFIRRKDFEHTGLFDEGVWMYAEEDILAKKIKRIGKKTGVDSSVSYIHYGSVTTKKVFKSIETINHMFHSSVYYFNHYQSKNVLLQLINYIICQCERIEDISIVNIKKCLKNFKKIDGV